jgi:SAM-dependent methyltransferase
MRTVPAKKDAFGQEIWAFLHGGVPYEIVERDDGLISTAKSVEGYFAPFRHWPMPQKIAMSFVEGQRILDVGCGAGRVSLYLQEKGLRVTGIDSSPLAIKTSRKRGVRDARLLAFEDIRRLRKNRFDTVVMFGNNFGLFGSRARAKVLLKRLADITNDRSVILAESLNPFQTDNPVHLRYQSLNRRRGRMPGQIRIRVRFQEYVGPWFDYLLVSPQEMRTLLRGTGWKVRHIIRDTSPIYVVVIEKVPDVHH